jgi:hypothetical protein
MNIEEQCAVLNSHFKGESEDIRKKIKKDEKKTQEKKRLAGYRKRYTFETQCKYCRNDPPTPGIRKTLLSD